MTEEEAKTKWCPHREETALSTDRCIGSGCMMFRKEFLHISGREYVSIVESDRVYCGLAGKPINP